MTKMIVAPSLVPGTHVEEGTLRHDAFGKIRVVKTSWGGGGAQLFGSELRHHNVVTVTIDRATTTRKYHANNVHDDGHIVEFSMSESQWAQFISSQGLYSGTPVTLNYAPPRGTRWEAMPAIQMESFVKTFSKEIETKTRESVAEVSANIEKLSAIIDGNGGMSKKEMRALLHTLKCQVGNMPSNMRFIQDQLHKAVAHTVSDGKVELESFVGNMAKNIGMEHLGLMAPSFEADVPTLTYDRATPDAIQLAEIEAQKKEDLT